jgi:CRISPR-associated protein Csx10
MQRLRYRITTLAPVLVTNHGGDPNMTTTARFIPGSTVLGIFAAKFPVPAVPKRKDEDDCFYQWFLQGRLRFHNAYIVDKQGACDYNCVPVPYSIQKEKATADIRDLLLTDPDEHERFKHEPGFCHLQEELICCKSVTTSLNFHHARDESTGTSKEGQIFNYEAICNDQVFVGYIEGTPEDLQQFRQIFAEAAYVAYAGRSKSSQYGKIKLEFLAEERSQREQKVNPPTAGELSLTMLSDTIIYNDCGFSTTDTGGLEKLLGVKVKRAFARAGTVQNYVAVWNMKRPAETCFAAGSCFLLEVKEADIPNLLNLQENGLGERTQEGFGRIALGWQTKAQLSDATQVSSTPARPAGEPPQLTCQIVASIVNNLVQQQVVLEAMEDARDFSKSRPSKSLISRLEAIAKTAGWEPFKEFLDQLKDTAKRQLEGCRDRQNSTTLCDFLNKRPDRMQKIERSNGYLNGFKNLLDEAHLALGQPPMETGETLDRLYLVAFFSHMRKELKGAKQ